MFSNTTLAIKPGYRSWLSHRATG